MLLFNTMWFYSGLSLELSGWEQFSGIQGEVLAVVYIFGFPLCSIHLNFSLSLKNGEVSQIRETFSSKLPPRLSPVYYLAVNKNDADEAA